MPDNELKIILASSSPRRSELLSSMGLTFEIVPSFIRERPHQGEALAEYTIGLARAKAAEVAAGVSSGIVIGADTIVAVDGQVLGKPMDVSDARRMLRLLSGRWHEVLTGVSLLDTSTGREVDGCETTKVRFSHISEQEIDWYIESLEPFGKSGAYAIQGRAAIFAEEISGNYQNVVGLPLPLVYRLARELGYSLI